ncbi:MAG: transposase, partial [Candidatus Falkowbacteria bacterium]|nr:transposase [Candidatus Falkowbacteria bacterium]
LDNQEKIIKQLEQEIRSLKKDSSTSSKPPSTDNNKPKKNQSLREKTDKKSGGQKGNNGNSKKLSSTPDKIVDCKPCNCKNCDSSLSDIHGVVVDKRQEIDIPPIKLEVTEYRLLSVICPNCEKNNLGKYPENINSNNQFGVNIKSFITYLNIKHKIPFKRLTEIFDDMLNTKISEGTIENSLEQLKIKSLNIYQGILDTIKKEQSGHQLCHPHLIRDLNYLTDVYKNSWCHKMKKLLLKSEKARDRIWKDGFNEKTRNVVIKSYNRQLEILLTQNLSKTKEVATLQKRFKKHSEKILYFMNFKDVPFHNNSSERAIRNAKIHKSGFRSEAGAERHAVLLSVIETCKKQNLNVLDSLKQIYLGSFFWKSA